MASSPPKPGLLIQQYHWRLFQVREDRARAPKRDHSARQKDAARDRLAADVEAYLARGGRIAEAVRVESAPGKAPARASER
jgi:hypothetical protein